MERLFIPLDGSAFAETALPVARALARRFEAELHLVSAISDLPPVPLASGDGDLITRWFDAETKRASEYLERISGDIAGSGITDVRTHVRSGPVTRTLEAIADEIDASVVIMTTHGRGAWQRAWLGSVADALVRSGKRPVLLLRERDTSSFVTSGVPAKVVVPLDGSSAGETVLAPLRAFADPAATEIELLMVLQEPIPMATSYMPQSLTDDHLMEIRAERARTYLDGVAARLTEEGFTVNARTIIASDAGHGIIEHLEHAEADLVALATRGHGGAARLLLGSVADKVIRTASIPVLVSRRGGDQSGAADSVGDTATG